MRLNALAGGRKSWLRRMRGGRDGVALWKQSTELEVHSQAELQKKSQEVWTAVAAMVRTAARLCKKGRVGGDEDEEEESETQVDKDAMRHMVQPFGEALESIEKAFDEKEEEMKELRRDIEKA